MAEYRPINLTGLQIGLESGGQQFDPKTGKPLTSKKGAIGVAQVMPDTGPEAARDAGLPWDPVRYKNDRDYNMKLGDAYQGKLNRRFKGDRLAATAAYNAGPTAVASLQKEHGPNWAKHLPQETKKYVKHILGVDVGKAPAGYYQKSRADSFSDEIAGSLGVEVKPYEVDAPKPGESQSTNGMFGIEAPSEIDSGAAKTAAKNVQTSTGRYAQYLEGAIAPIQANSQEVVRRTGAIASTKESLANDFKQRQMDLENKIRPLQEQRQRYLDQLGELDKMNPLERRLKVMFNSNWDPRVIEGRMSRVQARIDGHEATYKELNEIRSGVAALSVDAEAADIDTLNAQSRGIIADASLLGQVAGAVRQNADTILLPAQMQVEQLKLTETMKQGFLGRLTVEQATKYYNDAQNSPNGKISVDGVELTVGDLQTASASLQRQDLSLKSLKSAYATQDLELANRLEDDVIEHMSPEQVQQALQNGGKHNGQQLSVMKLSQAATALQNIQEQRVNEVVLGTAAGQAGTMLRTFGGFIQSTSRRAVEMFGNNPGELEGVQQQITADLSAWKEGMDNANKQGIGREYIARTAGSLQALQTRYNSAIETVAKKWGGGKPELTAVAESYIRGNPISGDTAIKGLISIAKSGMPAGAKMSGPALQALRVAQATVREWENPAGAKAGDSLEALMAGGGKKTQEQLARTIQDRVQAVYADGITDELLNQMPAIARQTRDPVDNGKIHPFARVASEDFINAVRHGDNEGFEKVGRDMGISGQQAQKMFAEGVDGVIWQAVKKSKGLNDGQFADAFASLQSIQMSATLQALDASHSARPGFSPAKAYIDFLQTPQVANKIDEVVNGYGRSNFGAFLVSSAAGGGYRDSWQGYTQSLQAVYTQQHSTELRQRIKQMQSIGGNPFTKLNAVNRAAGLSPSESQVLLNAVKPIAGVLEVSDAQMVGTRNPIMAREITDRNYKALQNIIRNHKFDDPGVEKLRKRVDSQWDAMDAMVGTIFDAVNE